MNELSYDIRISTSDRALVKLDDFRLPESAITILFGESGIGKSLTALAIAGLLDPDQLNVRINGKEYPEYLHSNELANLRRNGFFVFQEPSSHLNPLMTLHAQLREGTLARAPGEERILQRLWEGTSPSDVQAILDVYPKPYRPSGGEKQRILATMAFKKMGALEAQKNRGVFVFDEPTGNLDNKLRDEFLDLLVEQFRDRHATILLITHDYSMISRFTSAYKDLAKRIYYKELLLDHGKLRIRDFSPTAYLDWIGSRKPVSKAFHQDDQALRLESHIRIFGRTLQIARSQSERKPVPLLIRKGSLVYLKAPSGAGKTTVVKVMMGLLKAEGMSMTLGKRIYTETTPRKAWSDGVWGKQMAMVFQHADEALNQNATVKDAFAGLPLNGPMNEVAIVRTLAELFEEGVDRDFLRRPVKYLSGGQKQRLNLLRSMVLDTDILILDEPLNGLDFESSLKVLSRIEDRLRRGKSALVISHNEEIFDTMVNPENVYYLHALM